LAVALRVKDARVTLADVSQEALAVARKNAVAQKLSARVSCVHADALSDPAPFLGKFDMIISNPPYITRREMWELPDSVRRYEPHLALYGGEDGLDIYRRIALNAPKYLTRGGALIMEVGAGQAQDVVKLFKYADYSMVMKDFNGVERFVKIVL
jgi:release factor glutamine methyltransferase